MVLATEFPDSMTSGYSVPWTRNGMPCMARACSAKQSMNAAPMTLRFFSGSVTFLSDAKNRAEASMRTRGISKRRWNSDSTRSPSPVLSSPVSTNTHVRRLPMARCTSVAATELSTPVSYTHLRAHETRHDLVCRLLLEKKNTKTKVYISGLFSKIVTKKVKLQHEHS